ncbi:uncharacterized protein [Venturia canescens]|uniref:uncharacterized protein n=1 Tax=Venturia canescens TaxID=32260 RepID=UPI001C9D0D8B|nr:uncharacterized protein LOC122414387 [Venturia canescens]
MLHVLLPFFLAVSIPSPGNETWQLGPEYKFSARVRMISALDRDEGASLGNDMKADLRCQPASLAASQNRTLICRLENSVIGKINPRAYDVYGKEESDGYNKFGLMKEFFGVEYNERGGIEGYVIEKTAPPLAAWSLNMARLIVNQLSIGGSVADEFTPEFRISENFTFGECDVDYTVSRKPARLVADSKRNFELVALDKLGDFHEESIEIEKIRDVNDCLVRADYFFGSRYTYGIVMRDVLTKIKSSRSRIFISKNELRAETVNEVELFGMDRKRQGNVLDHMEIELVSVTPAKEIFASFKNPVYMEVLANHRAESPARVQ